MHTTSSLRWRLTMFAQFCRLFALLLVSSALLHGNARAQLIDDSAMTPSLVADTPLQSDFVVDGGGRVYYVDTQQDIHMLWPDGTWYRNSNLMASSQSGARVATGSDLL